MTYEILVSADSGYIIVKVVGEITRENASQFGLQAQEKGIELGLNRYLFDVRQAVNVESTLDNYEYAYQDMKTTGLRRSARVALLAREGDRSHRFIEVVTRNAGYNVRMFTDEVLAVEWLKEE